ncbi:MULTISPECIES: hypothetical protein [unclassified Methanoregula]|uniref:hypothetical protein n=1 Tax=unclassified Methanoregula TaxID=2649730 RepID=UPI0009C8F265|nr:MULTISPECIES: hypothetical protein [unclassified Methanoregula]OPX62492.1 MAG: hypothetical protein A4E33_02241 [Methanoregula sp. PtaB.Bin085]OPY31591.1 MAG: hypothetical protein A4E34_02784 [Methanoregula sp. PtaU1.Bin006]
MEDTLITEYAGTRRDPVSRYYQYGGGGVRVLDTKKMVKRLYLFDPSANIMTERDPRKQETILRRFIFDRYGMLEETFAFGERPRTFRYEEGGRRIAVREGGDYGAVGQVIAFEDDGVTETAWGRHGEIGRVFQFDPRGESITIRKGGYYGDIERTIVFADRGALLFRDPDAFLQFLVFTEWSGKDRDEHTNDRVAEIRREGAPAPGRSPFAFTRPAAPGKPAKIQGIRKDARKARGNEETADIDFIADADAPAARDSRGQRILSRQSREIPFEERRDRDGTDGLSRGRSAEIPLEERLGSSLRDNEPLSRGKSAEIPLDERFGNSERERGKKLSRGRSADIPWEERRGGSDR